MRQAVLEIESLPEAALEASAQFHAEWLPKVEGALEGDIDALAIVLPAAPYDHADWRRVVAHDLARTYTPKRVNLVGGADSTSIGVTLAYLEKAPGVTGHYLPLNSEGAGDPLETSG